MMVGKVVGEFGGLEVEELDQAGNVVATYIASSKGVNEGRGMRDGERIDVVIPERTNSRVKVLLYSFLPAGYPHSVTSDYLEYQIYDSLQAFASSIASLLASRAVLQGIGVGDADAAPTTALLLSILQSSLGQITTIIFAHRLGTALEPECKMYRLLADIFNDSAFLLDCLSPVLSKSARVAVYALSSMLRAGCGVSAGSSKASLSAHFAKWGNLGELNAKDSSQETVISLVGILAGTVVVSCISSQFATWSTMIFLVAIHLGMNYMAVRAVSMRTLNRQRANIVFSHFLSSSPSEGFKDKQKTHLSHFSEILSPKQVSSVERIFERDGVLRWNGKQKYGSCVLGVDLQRILKEMSRQNPHSKSFTNTPIDSRRLVQSLQTRGYFLWYNPSEDKYQITFSTTSTTKTQLLAWFHALFTACELRTKYPVAHDSEEEMMGVDTRDNIDSDAQVKLGDRGRSVIRRFQFPKEGDERMAMDDLWEFLDGTGVVAAEKFEVLWKGLVEMGWDLETGALETRSGTRVKVWGSVGSGGVE